MRATGYESGHRLYLKSSLTIRKGIKMISVITLKTRVIGAYFGTASKGEVNANIYQIGVTREGERPLLPHRHRSTY